MSKAAEDLGLSQSSLSKQVALLEARLGLSLFERNGHGLTLTQAGERLRVSIENLYGQIDLAIDAINPKMIVSGAIRLATVHTLSYYFAGDVVARFIAKSPEVNLSLLGRSSADVVKLVESDRADLGLVYDVSVDTDKVVSTPLFDDEMALIVREHSPIAGPQDITKSKLRLVSFPEDYALRRMIKTANLQATHSAVVETIDAMLKLVSADVGVCILPSKIPDRLLLHYGLRKVIIKFPLLSRKVVAIFKASNAATSSVQSLLRCVMQVAEEIEVEKKA